LWRPREDFFPPGRNTAISLLPDSREVDLVIEAEKPLAEQFQDVGVHHESPHALCIAKITSVNPRKAAVNEQAIQVHFDK
jgi:hypothetical protein